MIDYSALRATLSSPPYDAMSDAEAAAALKIATRTEKRPIVAEAIKKLWSRWMVLARAEIASEDLNLSTELRVVCRATVRNLAGDVFADLDTEEPQAKIEIAQYLGALVAAGVLTPEQRDTTLALADVTVNVADAIGCGALREMDDKSAEIAVATARKG
jgi:hypothetical protein